MSEKLRSSSPTTKGLQQTGTGGTNINVAIRCRPTTNEESRQSQSAALVCDTDNKSLTLSFGPPGKKTAKNYAFEKCFDAQATQEDIFESVARPVVNEALAGYNCTIFAYGQTGITNRTFFIDHHSMRRHLSVHCRIL
jgi:kinesin family member 11